MSINALRTQLTMCQSQLSLCADMIKITVQQLDELAAENNAKPKDEGEKEVRKTFGGSRQRETANGAAA